MRRIYRPTRRSFLQQSSAFAALALAGCATQRTDRILQASDFGDLRVVNWELYLDLELLPEIERFVGATIDYQETYQDNQFGWEEIIQPALAGDGDPGFDIIMPTNWLAARMVADGLVEPIPLEVVPNHVNIDPAYLVNDWDRGSRFQMPWQAGITGIAYDPNRAGRALTSIGDLFDPALDGRVALIVEMRETVGFGMLLNGDDPSRPTPESAFAGLERIEAAVADGKVAAFVANEFIDGLSDGTYIASMAWSGDAVLAQQEGSSIEFVIPDEGAISWFDTMVIPKGSPSVGSAGRWMNWMYDPANAALVTSYVQYISPVRGVQDNLRALGGDSASLADSPILFPDAETRDRLFTWGTLSSEVEDELDQRFNALLG